LARVRRRAGKVELTPGISSIQMACARAGISMEDAVFITLHQRRGASDDFASDVEEVVHFLKDGRRHVILLPRPYDLMPPRYRQGTSVRGHCGRQAGHRVPAPYLGRRETVGWQP